MARQWVGRCLVAWASRCEARLGMCRWGRMRKRALPMMRCSRAWRVGGSQPMWASRAAHFQAEAAKPSAATTPCPLWTR